MNGICYLLVSMSILVITAQLTSQSYSQQVKEVSIDGRDLESNHNITYNIDNEFLKLVDAILYPNTNELYLKFDNKLQDKASFVINLNRFLLDSKNYTKDYQFEVLLGGLTQAKYIETDNNKNNRTLDIEIPTQYESITIKGSKSLEGESIIKSNSPFISLMIAFGSVLFLFFIILKLFRKAVSKKGKKEKIWDIMLDEDWYPSLPRFQIFVWTVIIVFAFVWITSFKLINMNMLFADIPYNLLILMGLSAGTYTVGTKLSQYGYNNPKTADLKDRKSHSFKTMLYEGDKKSLTRIQYFGWTIISIATYLVVVTITMVYQQDIDVELPDIPGTLVFLMGIGQGAYLGSKFRLLENLFKEKDETNTSGTNADNNENESELDSELEENKIIAEGDGPIWTITARDKKGKEVEDIEINFSSDNSMIKMEPPTKLTDEDGKAKTKIIGNGIGDIKGNATIKATAKIDNVEVETSIPVSYNDDDADE